MGWGRGMCEGWSLEIGTAFRGAVVRQDRFEQPIAWMASLNDAHLGEGADRAGRAAGMARPHR